MRKALQRNPGKHKPVWRVLGESARGAAHARCGRANQDAISWRPLKNGARYAALAVADGHGGARYFRSRTGAHLAAENAVRVLEEFRRAHRFTAPLSVVKNVAEEKLPFLLYRRWQEAVEEHFKNNPLSEAEREQLPANASTAKAAEESPHLCYGTTLLALLLTPRYAVVLQLGDGDILTVSEKGEVMRPLPADPALFAEETSSLGMPQAWREFRVCFQAFTGKYPALFMVSTDGYANSFQGDREFLKVGPDLFNLLNTCGPGEVSANLYKWLEEASRQGSGDDVTLGLIYRVTAAQQNRLWRRL